MASSQDLIFGQIGAAKMFCGKLSSSLDASAIVMSKANNDKIARLEEQQKSETDGKRYEKIQNKINKLKKRNGKLESNVKKVKNAVDYLSMLAEKLDMGKEQIIDLLSKIMIVVLPEMEYTLKAVLLANIKKLTSCALDVSIPDWMRDEGILVNETEIDPRHILQIAPASKYGHHHYFGIDKPNMSSYELAKAEDMNAFLWFVKNCAKFVSPIKTNGHMTDYFQGVNDTDALKTGFYTANMNGKLLTIGTVLKDFSVSDMWYIVQNVIDQTDESTGKPKKLYDITTLTCDDRGIATTVSWYTQNTQNKGWYVQGTKNKESKPLFSLEYSNVYNSSASLPTNNFKFKIMPKPFVMASSIIADLGYDANKGIDDLATLTRNTLSGSGLTKENIKEVFSGYKTPLVGNISPRKALFDERGKYNKKGRYSINQKRFYITNGKEKDDDINKIVYHLESKDGLVEGNLIYDKKNDVFELCDNNGTSLTGKAEVTKYICECYKGNTVYEFNYDYIMSVKLFDEKVMAANIINTIMGLDIPINVLLDGKGEDITSSSYNSVYIRTMIDQTIQKMLDAESEEYTSCFYDFSNEEYVNMEEQTALKVMNGQLLKEESISALTEAYDILEAYDADATLHERTEVITRTISKALESIEDDNDDYSMTSDRLLTSRDSYNEGHSKFYVLFKKALRAAIQEITYAILSPKVLMLIAINKKLMQDKAIDADYEENNKYKFNYIDVFKGIEGIISSMVKNVIDEVEKEVLRVIMARITELMNNYTLQLAKEYTRNWQTFLKSLLSCFNLNGNNLKANGAYDSSMEDSISAILDKVDTADLDELAGQIIPDTNPC